jgi:hypothetical protein
MSLFPQNAPAPACQKNIPAIMVTRQGVLTAIGFNDEPCFNASEIGEIWWNGKLATKSEAELVAPQEVPQAPLRVGRRPAQRSGARGENSVASHRDRSDDALREDPKGPSPRGNADRSRGSPFR